MYHGRKRLNYTKIHNENQRKWDFDPFYGTPKSPEGFLQATLAWLKENLPKVVLNGLIIRQICADTIQLTTAPDYTTVRRTAYLEFKADHVGFRHDWVELALDKTRCKTERKNTDIPYCDPKMFDILRQHVLLLYNSPE